jgi:hypothetical protein
MRLLRKNNGFTLIETLVAINLSFIAVGFIFSFYLFAQRFTDTLSRNFIDKYLIQNIFNKTVRMLKGADYFEIINNNGAISIVTDGQDFILISANSMSLKNILNITELEKPILTIKLFSGKELVLQPGDIENNVSQIGGTDFPLQSSKIKCLLFEIIKKDKKYSFEYFTPAYAIIASIILSE